MATKKKAAAKKTTRATARNAHKKAMRRFALEYQKRMAKVRKDFEKQKGTLFDLDDPAITRPTKVHLALAKMVVDAEPKLIQGQMVCKEGGHCAAGAILAFIGVPEARMDDLSSEDVKKLYKTFRMDGEDLSTIIGLNDEANSGSETKDGTKVFVEDDGDGEDDGDSSGNGCTVDFVHATKQGMAKRRAAFNRAMKRIANDDRDRTITMY